MPSKKKKYNARFPPARIKKIMQSDEEVGKVAQAVPVIISRALELFVESLLAKTGQITSSRNAKTLTPSHLKQCILSEQRFDFLKELVATVQDSAPGEDEEVAGRSAIGVGAMSATTGYPIPTSSHPAAETATMADLPSAPQPVPLASSSTSSHSSYYSPSSTSSTLRPNFYQEISAASSSAFNPISGRSPSFEYLPQNHPAPYVLSTPTPVIQPNPQQTQQPPSQDSTVIVYSFPRNIPSS